MSEPDSSPLPLAGGVGGGQATFKKRNTARAQVLRNAASPPERLLWQHLRNRQLEGHKFSRQMPVGPFFADFLCREARLVIELDGATHDDRLDEDARRDAFMRAQGYAVLRFQNADVMGNLEGVLGTIADALRAAHPQPLPQAGGEQAKPAALRPETK